MPAGERRIWSVRSLVADLRQRIELGYADLWVEGEISSCRPASSGHIYFTLKDGEAQLPVVLFRRQAQLLRFRPADGLAVLVRGRISVYDTRGQLQLIAETMEPRGAGALQLAFDQLKARLLAEGLFDAGRKRPLPAYPRSVGIVTSPGGAVIRDILTVVRRRHARLNLLIHPATMQGSSCPASVARGIRWFNRNPGRVDLIVLARGGGSPEDLAGFNDEALARAIAASQLPVVSAIGHETDFTIADFVSDLRAPTPSAAAEIVTAHQHRIEERLEAFTAPSSAPAASTCSTPASASAGSPPRTSSPASTTPSPGASSASTTSASVWKLPQHAASANAGSGSKLFAHASTSRTPHTASSKVATVSSSQGSAWSAPRSRLWAPAAAASPTSQPASTPSPPWPSSRADTPSSTSKAESRLLACCETLNT